jgi:hypothetical protein
VPRAFSALLPRLRPPPRPPVTQLDGTATGAGAGGARISRHPPRAFTPSRARMPRTFRSRVRPPTPAGRRAARSASWIRTSRRLVVLQSRFRRTLREVARSGGRYKTRQPAQRYGWTTRACGARGPSLAPRHAARESGRPLLPRLLHRHHRLQ